MSNQERHPGEQRVCTAEDTTPCPDTELLTPREVPLGGPRAMPVLRSLPGKNRRMIGAWCFADVYGPTDISHQAGMQVPPHPHIGLQTVSWLVRGRVHHRDSLGSDQLVQPGQLSIMTAGHGIAHSERTPQDAHPVLHGAQLWIALPEGDRHGPPAFAHHDDLPVLTHPGARLTVIAGDVDGHRSPARVHTPLMGAEVTLDPGAHLTLPLDPDFEHGVLPLDTPLDLLGHHIEPGALLYLGPGRHHLDLAATRGARLLVIGGTPFTEDLLMWWNLVGRDHDEIVRARTDWERARTGHGTRFAPVTGDPGPALPAPELPTARMRPRPPHRR
ncbi:pirin family protein [Nocardiopsis sp. NPDC049922]|uniref:pirin family protein n=1 Tax=Nocardiopsis sp. NPDC049922 TaxID=3155157 RepID=UPI00340BFFEB